MADLFVGGLTFLEDDRGRLHFWGEVLNLGDTAQRWATVTVRLLNEAEEVVAEQSDLLGLEWTLPGARNPFHLRFLDIPSTWISYDVRVTGQAHNWEDPNVPQPHTGLLAEKLHFREIERADLRCSIIGLLSNHTLMAATHVKVAATLYGPGGKVVGVLTPYLVPRGAIYPGDEQSFELKFYALGGTVVNYTVQVQGRLPVEEQVR